MNDTALTSEIIARLEQLHDKVFGIRKALQPILRQTKPEETTKCSQYSSEVMKKIEQIIETVNYLSEDIEL